MAASGSPTVSDDLAKKFATEKDTPYLRWVRGEGLDIIGAQYVPNLRTVDLKPWPRRGGSGAYVNHDASRASNDCYVCAIPPGRKLAPQRQLFEEMILILEGRASGQHGVKDGAERINVALRPHWVGRFASLLRRHVGRRAHDHAERREPGEPAGLFGNAEIHDDGPQIAIDENIGRFEIAMDDSAAMGVMHGLGQHDGQGDCTGDFDFPFLNQALQGVAVD